MYHVKEGSSMTSRRFDLSLLAIAALLVLQTSLVSYGVAFVRDIAVTTHERLAAVAHAGRR
jgi:hypothetical protein